MRPGSAFEGMEELTVRPGTSAPQRSIQEVGHKPRAGEGESSPGAPCLSHSLASDQREDHAQGSKRAISEAARGEHRARW